jgi:hypothetical protein
MGRGREALKVGALTALTIAALVVLPLLVYVSVQLVPESSPTTWTDPEVSDDGRSVTVSFTGGACDDPESEVEESAAQVTITVRNVDDWFVRGCSDVGIGKQVTVELDEPLGNRELVDGSA